MKGGTVVVREVVIGVDSSTQSTKVLVADTETGEVLSEGRAPHTGADIQEPNDWWAALRDAIRQADPVRFSVRAIAVAAQQHGLVTLDESGGTVRPAPLWNNTDAAEDAELLNDQADFAGLVGMRLVASVTIAKLANLARMYPDDLERTSSVCLPHDFLNYRLTGQLTSDRGDSSGTGWWSPIDNSMKPELLELAVGAPAADRLNVPNVIGPDGIAGTLSSEATEFLGLPVGIPVAAGTGDNMGAALGIGATLDELVVSLGTSGTAYAVTELPTADETGEVAGFADATGRYLPLACMLNCTRVVDSMAEMFDISVESALDLAENTPPGADGLLLVPYLGGERVPNLPNARGQLRGVTSTNLTKDQSIRSAVDGVAAGLAYCLQALDRVGVSAPVIELVGGGSAHPTWRQAIADATGLPVEVRDGSEHVARGAVIQAAAIISGKSAREIAEAWRPPVAASVDPRPEFKDAFRLDERRAIIDDMRENPG